MEKKLEVSYKDIVKEKADLMAQKWGNMLSKGRRDEFVQENVAHNSELQRKNKYLIERLDTLAQGNLELKEQLGQLKEEKKIILSRLYELANELAYRKAKQKLKKTKSKAPKFNRHMESFSEVKSVKDSSRSSIILEGQSSVNIPTGREVGSAGASLFEFIPSIGKHEEEVLVKAGINSYETLSKTSVSYLSSLFDTNQDHRFSSAIDSWPLQASFVMNGLIVELKQLQAKLSR